MGFFASPIGLFVAVTLSLMLVAMNILDVITYRKIRDSHCPDIKETQFTHKTTTFVAVAILLLLGFELGAWA